MFIYNLIYTKPLEEVDAMLPAHRDYLDRHYAAGHFICSGRKALRVGGLTLVNLTDAATARAIMEEDPFYQNGLADFELIEFTPTKYAEGFASFVEPSTP